MDEPGRLIYLALLLAAVGGWVIVEYRGRLGQATRVALAWGMIFLGVAAGYGVWQDIRGDGSQVQAVTGDGAVRLPRARDGHFYAEIEISGQVVTFMVDTGATAIVLSDADARRLGFEPESLAFTGTSDTANGPVPIAPVTLRQVTLGPFTDTSLPAFVNGGEMEGSLLGMTYLGRFRVEIAGEEMVLRR